MRSIKGSTLLRERCPYLTILTRKDRLKLKKLFQNKLATGGFLCQNDNVKNKNF